MKTPNRIFAEDNKDFRACCVEAGLKEITVRQASKFRMRKGLAYKAFKKGVRADG